MEVSKLTETATIVLKQDNGAYAGIKKEINYMVGEDSNFREKSKILDVFSCIDFIPYYVYDVVPDITTLTNPTEVMKRICKLNKEDLLDYMAIDTYLKNILFMKTYIGGSVEVLNNQVLTRSRAKASVSPDAFSTPVKSVRDNVRKYDGIYGLESDYRLFYSTLVNDTIGSLLSCCAYQNFAIGSPTEDARTIALMINDHYEFNKPTVDRGSRVLNSLLPKDGNIVNFLNTFDIKFYNLNIKYGDDYRIVKGAIVILREGFGSYLRSSKELESIIEMYRAIYLAAINNYDIKSVTNSPFFTLMTKINAYKSLSTDTIVD